MSPFWKTILACGALDGEGVIPLSFSKIEFLEPYLSNFSIEKNALSFSKSKLNIFIIIAKAMKYADASVRLFCEAELHVVASAF